MKLFWAIQRLLTIKAIFLVLIYYLDFSKAVPALSTTSLKGLYFDSIPALDDGLPDCIDILLKHSNTVFTIEKEIYVQIGLLMVQMDNEKYQTEYPINKLTATEFQMVIDYLKNPKNAKSKWTMNELPDLVINAGYLDIDSLLKDSFQKLCHEMSDISSEKMDIFYTKVPTRLFATFLHCTGKNPPENWKFRNEAIGNRTEFSKACHVPDDYEMVDLKMILNPNLNCVNYLKKQTLNLVLNSQVTMNFDKVHDYIASAKLLNELKLKISLYGLCKKLSEENYPEFESLFSRIHDSEIKNALLHCVNEHSGQNWSLRNDALEKRNAFQTQCNNVFNDDVNYLRLIVNAKSVCIDYINTHLQSVISPKFSITYDNLKDFDAAAGSLQSSNFDIFLNLEKSTNPSLLYSALKKVPNLTHLNIFQFNTDIDMSQFPEMPQLRDLSVSYCQLSNLSCFFERSFPSLEALALSKNHLTNIGQFKSMPKLKILNLSLNQLKDISEFMTSSLPKLTNLNLDSNQLGTIGNIDSFSKLDELKISNNHLNDISELLTSNLTKCRVYLSQNYISRKLVVNRNIKRHLYGLENQKRPPIDGSCNIL